MYSFSKDSIQSVRLSLFALVASLILFGCGSGTVSVESSHDAGEECDCDTDVECEPCDTNGDTGNGCIPNCTDVSCGEADGCGQICESGSGCECSPTCDALTCGEENGCGEVCEPGSGCACSPECDALTCGEADGCGQICEPGSGCACASDCHAWHPVDGPVRDARPCGEVDQCGNVCQPGSGCVLSGSDPDPGLSSVDEWYYTVPIVDWPVTITINSASISWIQPYQSEESPGLMHVSVNYDSYDRIPLHYWYGDYGDEPWGPNQHNVNLQIGILRYYQGQLVYGTVDYLRVGQFGKEVGVAHQWKFMPQSGDTVWIVVSTLSRPPYEAGTVGPEGESYYERSWPFPVTVP